MKRFARTLLLFIILLAASVITITACGGNKAPGTITSGLSSFIFNSNPVGFHVTKGFGAARSALSSPFAVNAQSPTPGGGNFSGFCNSINSPAGRGATVIYGLGLWTSGDCTSGGILADSDVGVSIPQSGQIGNVSVDAVGTGTGADDGIVGLSSTGSGQIEIDVLHADGTRTASAISCTLGISNNAKVHCDDKTQSTHHTDVVAGDQVIARFWFNP